MPQINNSDLKEILEIIISEDDERKFDFDYPVESLQDGYLHTFKERMDEYLKRINSFPRANIFGQKIFKEIDKISNLKDEIENIILEYLSGRSKEAFEKFSYMINDYRTYIEKLSFKYEENSKFYRMRISKDKNVNKLGEIFHISFDKRYLVSTQRYSVAGVPSLYLGNSLYACWQELEKPNLDDTFISEFNSIQQINILDFAITFNILKNSLDTEQAIKEEKKFLSFFILYPLIFACSFKKQYKNANFNIEYIIPNMILQWLSNEKEHFHGIRYFSTKMNHKDFNSKGINIVLPPKENKNSLRNEYCPRLKSLFSLTKPIHWTVLSSLQFLSLYMSGETVIYEDIEEALLKEYEQSLFGQNEDKLNNFRKELLH